MADANLRGFIEAVNSDVDKQIDEILTKADEKRNEILDKAENDALNDAYAKIRACVTEEKAKSKMAVSKAEQEARIKVLTHREELVRKIFDNVEVKVSEFTNSEAYKKFLAKLIRDEKTDDNTVIYLKPEDMKYENMLRALAGAECTFEEDNGIKYGGLSVYYKTSSILINKTIDNMLDEQKKDFGSKYRLA